MIQLLFTEANRCLSVVMLQITKQSVRPLGLWPLLQFFDVLSGNLFSVPQRVSKSYHNLMCVCVHMCMYIYMYFFLSLSLYMYIWHINTVNSKNQAKADFGFYFKNIISLPEKLGIRSSKDTT